MKNRYQYKNEDGSVGTLVAIVSLAVLSVILGGVAIWSYVQFNEKSTDVNGQIERAKLEAKKEQADEDQARFDKQQASTVDTFTGPDDYGRVTFNYPKSWSTFVETDVTRGGDYKAFLHPGKVPPISEKTQYAIRVLIENENFDKVTEQYARLVKKGDLRTGTTSLNGVSVTRYDGNFSKDIRGAAVVVGLRDKTLTIRTDADTFKPYFNDLIKTLRFNQ